MGIYKIENTRNSKVYIGQTLCTFGERWYQHKYSAKHGGKYHLHKSMRKHKIKNFDFEAIFIGFSDVITPEELTLIEQHYIEEYDSMNPQKGYNRREAGSNGRMSEEVKEHLSKVHKGQIAWNKGKKMSESYREKCRKRQVGKKRTEEAKRKTSESLKQAYQEGRMVAYFKGKKHSDETRKKMSETHKKRLSSEEARKKFGEAHRGRVVSDETRKKISEAKKGRKLSEEHKQKLRKPKQRRKG